MADSTGLLIKVRGDGAGFAAATQSMRVGQVDSRADPHHTAAAGPGWGAGANLGATWLKLGAKDPAARKIPGTAPMTLLGAGGAFAAAGGPEILAVEPDMTTAMGL